jgi:hypothetical protein
MGVITHAHKRVKMHGSLEFRVTYAIETLPFRQHPFRPAAQYQPTHLTFTLASASPEDGRLPRYKDLHVSHIDIRGPRIKKDGTPGDFTVRETLYRSSREPWPPWAEDIVLKAIAELKGLDNG